ncbi:hypothetical protein AB0N09_05110 [Streptomyces erythrochromogenes]|uniref:hypothetical protein n=1 Tax=Streptomyces erythrochromogenes TaxID=285574 RepID=UPI003425F6A0
MAATRSKARGGKELVARRRAALERAALRVSAEREAAERAEAERLAREAEFDEMAADFELAREDEEQVAAEVEAELRKVRERGQARILEVRLVAARVVVAMGEKGETVAGCARRLGVGADRVKELRRLGREEEDAAVESEPVAAGVSPEAVLAVGRPRGAAPEVKVPVRVVAEEGGTPGGGAVAPPLPVRPVPAGPSAGVQEVVLPGGGDALWPGASG